MHKIRVCGFDPSLRNWGIAAADLDLDSGLLDTPDLSIIQTVDANEPAHPVREPTLAAGPEHVPEGWDADLMPWFLRRLEQAELLAAQMRQDADQLLKSSAG